MNTTTNDRRKRKSAALRAKQDKRYLAAIHERRCLVCKRWPVEAHHEPPKQMGGGGDWHDRKTVPLCDEHHNGSPRSIHALGKEGFERAYRLDLNSEITKLQGEIDASK